MHPLNNYDQFNGMLLRLFTRPATDRDLEDRGVFIIEALNRATPMAVRRTPGLYTTIDLTKAIDPHWSLVDILNTRELVEYFERNIVHAH